MAQNEFNVRRVAFGHFTIPSNTGTNTASVLSADCNVFIPKGAIVTGIKYYCSGAITNVSALKNATINVAVGTGAQALGTNNAVASTLLTAALPYTQTLAATNGVVVSVGGNLNVQLASSDSDRSALAGTADVYVEYLYCSDRDIT